ncbi:MAG TPA: amino acid adenylation domain-containing protein, partial [Usitatibacter sp.]|nr:amino acid adenylation domain-containing protein [Usitatibacter sp.]
GCGDVPASFGQEGIWLAERINPGTIAFNFPVQALRLEGDLDTRALERALDDAVRRHEALRTTFIERDGLPVQVAAPQPSLRLPVIDLSALPREARGREVNRLAIEAMEGAFDLAQGPLLRVSLVRWAPRLHVMLVAVHHIVFDVGSMGILLADLAALYQARAAGREPALPPLPAQYADFALWQRRCMRSAALRKQLEYWKRRLAGASELRWPTDRRRPATPSGRAVRETALLPRELADALKDLGRHEGVTPFVLTLAAFCVLAGRYASQEDVVVGSPVTLRRRPEVENVVGLFVNLVAIRADLSGSPTFRELLGRVREAALGALENSDAPFDHVVRELGVARSARHPLFQISFAYEAASTPLAFGDLRVECLRPDSSLGPGEDAATLGIHFDECLTRFDIETYAREVPAGLELEMQGSSDLFTRETLRSLLASLRALLAGVAARPDAQIAELPLLDAGERDRILRSRNATARDYPRDATIDRLFAEHARRSPAAHALEYADETLTYAQLDARAGGLAAVLRDLGVERGAAVGLAVPRSALLIVGMLGIVRAGAAYLPLDPDYPDERIAFMVRDTGARIILTDRSTAPRMAGTGARLVRIDELEATAGAPHPRGIASATDLAYVIYTSGSTGVPKGVEITHRGVARLVCNPDYTELGADARIAQASVATFDAATFEIWGALLNGGCIVGIPRDVALSPRELARFLREQRITHLFLTTALFNQVAREVPDAFAPLRYLFMGGEAASVEPIQRVLAVQRPASFVHVYGPTEVTTYALAHRVESLDAAANTVPIGRPIANTTAYVVDERGEPVPDGMPGELWLGGDGVARGYVNREELTREKFIPDRFGPDPSARLYRTGDWVRWGPGGVIEFIGRRDGQVKVRGFRIELGEIESALQRHDDVRECAVVVREDEPGERRVVAYVVPRAGATVRADDFRAALRQHLPEYMVPSAFTMLESLPLKANGKVDRDALPAPAAPRAAQAVAPRGALEERIAALWRELLKVDKVGAE